MTYLVGGVAMPFPIMVGAGACKTPASVLPYMIKGLPLGGVLTGSYTPDVRMGNNGVLSYPDDWQAFINATFGLNAFGMPNMGCTQAASKLTALFAVARWFLPLIPSIAGFSVEDYVAGIKIFGALPYTAAVEINFGYSDAYERKTTPIAYDLLFIIQILEAMKKLSLQCPVWIKLSPYITEEEREILSQQWAQLDFSSVPTVREEFLAEVLHHIMTYRHFVRAVVFSNTLPNVIFRDNTGKPVTSPNDGKAGLSGAIIKPISQKLLKQARKILPDAIDVIGCGGILTGDDAVDYFQAGASGIQCTSGPFWYGDGPRFFVNLVNESPRLQEYLTQQDHH